MKMGAKPTPIPQVPGNKNLYSQQFKCNWWYAQIEDLLIASTI
jgi:hypothetical protein